MKVSFTANKEIVNKHIDFFKSTTSANLGDVQKVTINYNLDMSIDATMLKRLREILEIAEEEDVEDFSIDVGKSLPIYAEAIRLLEDLKETGDRKLHEKLCFNS